MVKMAGDETLINATGTDNIYLWYLRKGRLRMVPHRYRSWIFVSGSVFDLDFLSGQLDDSSYRYEWSRRSDIFGTMDGITIWAKPSQFPDLIRSIEVIGLGRKFRIYNGDINPPLRFLSERSLHLLGLADPADPDPDIPIFRAEGHSLMGIPDTIRLNSGSAVRVTSKVLGDIEEMLKDSIIVVYDNRDRFFSQVLLRMSDLGYTVPEIRTGTGKSYSSYGQVHSTNQHIRMMGKICIESGSFVFSESDIPGVIETSRVSSLPMESVSMVTTGTAVSSMEESEAIRRGILIPLYKDDHEREKDITTLMMTDMGGMVLQPEPGIYQDVHEVDFSSMYPSITVHYNLSPETVGFRGSFRIPGTPYGVDMSRRGFLSMALEKLLNRRLFFKSIKGNSRLYNLRDTALKWMLLTSFGYTGYKNAKFGRIEVHESITAMGRHILMRAVSIAREEGFHAIHGIVDSLWLSGGGSIGNVLRRTEKETGIGIVEDGHYRWIVFLPARSGLGALNRYFGLRYDGTFKVRGIELRRSDSPEICREFQTEALELFRTCHGRWQILERKDDLESLKEKYLNMIGTASWDRLSSGFRITRHSEEYRVRNVQSSIIKEFRRSGLDIIPGERRKATVVDQRRKIVDPWDSGLGIDREYYRRLLERSFEPFDFLISSCSGMKSGQRLLTSFF